MDIGYIDLDSYLNYHKSIMDFNFLDITMLFNNIFSTIYLIFDQRLS